MKTRLATYADKIAYDAATRRYFDALGRIALYAHPDNAARLRAHVRVSNAMHAMVARRGWHIAATGLRVVVRG